MSNPFFRGTSSGTARNTMGFSVVPFATSRPKTLISVSCCGAPFFFWFLRETTHRTSIRSRRGEGFQIRPTAPRFRPRLELLEDRMLPSTFYAATASDLIADIKAANLQGGPTRLVSAHRLALGPRTLQGRNPCSGPACAAQKFVLFLPGHEAAGS